MDIKNTWVVTRPIAHRGLHHSDSPENSLSAFTNAIKNNYPIELDVRLTDDNEVVVFHDDSLKRMTGSDGYVININSKNLDHYRLQKTDEIIPTFEQTLQLINGKTPILIEIKNSNNIGVLESKLKSMLDSYNGDFAVQSFNPYSLEYFKNNAPSIMRGQLSCVFNKQDLPSFFKRFLLSRLKLNSVSKPDFIAYEHSCLPSKFVTKTKLPVLAWTVKNNSDMETVLPHCDNIIFEQFIPQITKD